MFAAVKVRLANNYDIIVFVPCIAFERHADMVILRSLGPKVI